MSNVEPDFIYDINEDGRFVDRATGKIVPWADEEPEREPEEAE